MSAGAKTGVNGFDFRAKKHPVFLQHSFTGFTPEGAINFQIQIAAQRDCSGFNQLTQIYFSGTGIIKIAVSDHFAS